MIADFEILCDLITIISAIVTTILISFNKWGLFELYQIKRELISKHLPKEICIFCLGFWFSCIVTLFTWLVYDSLISEILYIALPFACASVIKFLYNERGRY